jgi:hypothetical protein
LRFDSYIIDKIIDAVQSNKTHTLSPKSIAQYANKLIDREEGKDYKNNRAYIRQFDLYTIHHFDSNAKRTSLF